MRHGQGGFFQGFRGLGPGQLAFRFFDPGYVAGHPQHPYQFAAGIAQGRPDGIERMAAGRQRPVISPADGLAGADHFPVRQGKGPRRCRGEYLGVGPAEYALPGQLERIGAGLVDLYIAAYQVFYKNSVAGGFKDIPEHSLVLFQQRRGARFPAHIANHAGYQRRFASGLNYPAFLLHKKIAGALFTQPVGDHRQGPAGFPGIGQGFYRHLPVLRVHQVEDAAAQQVFRPVAVSRDPGTRVNYFSGHVGGVNDVLRGGDYGQQRVMLPAPAGLVEFAFEQQRVDAGQPADGAQFIGGIIPARLGQRQYAQQFAAVDRRNTEEFMRFNPRGGGRIIGQQRLFPFQDAAPEPREVR